ncbi:hypothetical protein BSLG_001904 [Batrachochytrium salamandrivorans]|nr:hypothetical protein BSLG_001904 [Batrachochytrium salamandrivorans]
MTMTANTGSSAATTNTAISSTPPPSHSALTVMPFGIHRSSMDSSTHGRFQRIYKRGREFKYMTAVDDDEMAATNTGSTVPNIHSTASHCSSYWFCWCYWCYTVALRSSMSNATSNPMSGSPQAALDSFLH